MANMSCRIVPKGSAAYHKEHYNAVLCEQHRQACTDRGDAVNAIFTTEKECVQCEFVNRFKKVKK